MRLDGKGFQLGMKLAAVLSLQVEYLLAPQINKI